MIFSAVLKYEVYRFLRSKGLLVAWILFLFTGLFCLQQGQSVYLYQKVAQDSAQAKNERNMQRLHKLLDTTKTLEGKRQYFEHPNYIDWLEQKITTKYLSPLSALSIGQTDVFPHLKSGRFTVNIFSNDFTDFKNPDSLMAGNLDVSFFVLFLFPLLLIALTYNVRSEDRESGISPLLQAQTPSLIRVQNIRLLVRWGIALIPVLLLCIISFFVLKNKSAFNGGQFLAWWSVALFYCLFWLSAIGFVQRFRWNSVINGIALCGSWVLLLIALPGLINTWFSYQYPNTYKLEVAEFRDESYKLWSLPKASHQAVLLERYPHLADTLANMEYSQVRSYSYAAQLLQAEKILYQKNAEAAAAQNLAEEKAFWVNPVGGVLRVMAGLGNATLSQQQLFEKSVLQYRINKMQFLFDNEFLRQNFTKHDLTSLPQYAAPVADAGEWGRKLLPLVLLTVFFALGTLLQWKKPLPDSTNPY